jgi:transposase
VIAERLRGAKKLRAGSVAALAIAWREHPDWHPEELAELEAWRRRDKAVWLRQENFRAKLLGRRKDYYQRMAREIVDHAGSIRMEEFDLAEAARIDETNPLWPAARRYRQIAAPSEFRLWLRQRAEKLGVPIDLHSGVSTWLCHVCGHRVQPAKPQELRQQCPSCLSYWDQDANATAVTLAAE